MHGEGYYLDKQGTKWEGILTFIYPIGLFVKGTFHSTKQRELRWEKELLELQNRAEAAGVAFFDAFEEVYQRSDKKTFKENLGPFFVGKEGCRHVKAEGYPKLEDLAPDRWQELVHFAKKHVKQVRALRLPAESSVFSAKQVLTPQLMDEGQLCELVSEDDGRKVQLVLCRCEDAATAQKVQVVVFVSDSAPPKPAKGK